MTQHLKGVALALAAALGGASLGLWASQPVSTAPASASTRPASASTPAALASCAPGQPTVTVDGYGSAEGPPDEMTLSLGAHSDALTAQAAISANAAKAQALVAVLAAAGVPKSEVQTSNLSVQPNYNEQGQITGYGVDDDLTVTLRGAAQLAEAGQVIDDAGRAAGDALRIDGITFSLSNNSSLMAVARAEAVSQARAQAGAMASAAGESLGAVCSLHDESQQSTPPPWQALGAAVPAATRTPVEPGSLQVTAQVSAVFALAPSPPAA
jgi:uncharacterized protein YggE